MTRNSPDDVAAGFVRNFRLEDYSLYLMAHVDHLYGQSLETALRQSRLSRVAWRALSVLVQHGPTSVGELAEVILIKRPTLSRLAERMERDGLVRRSARASDHRVTEVTITDKGRRVFDEMLEVISVQYAHAMKGLTKKDVAALNRILSRIILNLDETPLTLLGAAPQGQDAGSAPRRRTAPPAVRDH